MLGRIVDQDARGPKVSAATLFVAAACAVLALAACGGSGESRHVLGVGERRVGR